MTVIVPLALLLIAVLIRLAAVAYSARRAAGGDMAAALVALVAPAMGPRRQEWVQAMLAELPHVQGRWARLRFALGCAWTALVRPPAPSHTTGAAWTVVLAGVAASAALVVYGLARYPDLRTGRWTPLFVLVVAVALSAYAVVALVLSRDVTGPAVATRRLGLAGGLAAGALLTVPVSPAATLLHAAGYLSPLAFAALAARSGARASLGIRAACWTAVVAGLVFFVSLVAGLYVAAAGGSDPAVLADLGDNLGGAVFMLLAVPAGTGIAGCTGAVLGALRFRAA